MNKYDLIEAEVVLLVIDIQDRLVPAMKYGEQVIRNTNTLIIY
ncbi:Nicotinamidase-like amidase (fragment) [Candidatus Desulfosporosinus infrequens]|uniref:Nicotinamidase-like amidase n=1 Tax=Candidatus Desulfosporosinus infrequens TaxID=2043169 RepID=A0A2U3LIG4_9FIRM